LHLRFFDDPVKLDYAFVTTTGDLASLSDQHRPFKVFDSGRDHFVTFLALSQPNKTKYINAQTQNKKLPVNA